MKKILVYGFTYNMGGIESFYMNYYRKLDKKEYQIDFIKSYDKIAFEDELVNNGSRMFRLPNYNRHPVKFYQELTKILKKETYDVFHANMLTAANIAHLKVAKKYGVKTIIAHSHNSESADSRIKKMVHYFNRNIIKHYANRLVACSNTAAKWLFGDKTYKDCNVLLLNNAINLEKYLFNEKERKEIRRELGIKDDTLVLGHIGKFDKQKNHKFLIDIFNEVYKENKNTVLLLVGEGALEEEIKTQVKKLDLEKNVILLGKRSDVNRLYQAFDVFVLPSLYEGLPVVGIEAQANGLPCVFSNKITDEIKINSNVCTLGIEKNDLEKWKNIILEIKENNKRCTDLKKMYDNYDINSEIEKLRELYTN